MGLQYIYCNSHGAVHTARDGDPVWCTSAQKSGLILLYPAHMQKVAGWDDEQTVDFAMRYVSSLGLWLSSGGKYHA